MTGDKVHNRHHRGWRGRAWQPLGTSRKRWTPGHRLRIGRPRRWAWLPASKMTRPGTGRWRSSTITGSPATTRSSTLAEEMGVRERIIFPRPKTSYWLDGKISAQRDIAIGAFSAAVVWGSRLCAWRSRECSIKFARRAGSPSSGSRLMQWMRRWMGRRSLREVSSSRCS